MRGNTRFKELRELLWRRLPDEPRFTDETLQTVIGLLDGPGVVKELDYGTYILLAPEWINAYAQAVIRSPAQRGERSRRAAAAQHRGREAGLPEHRARRRSRGDEAGAALAGLAHSFHRNPGLRCAAAWAIDFRAFGAGMSTASLKLPRSSGSDGDNRRVFREGCLRASTACPAPKARESKAQADRGSTGRGEAWVS